jgi:hypothetical protein
MGQVTLPKKRIIQGKVSKKQQIIEANNCFELG